MHLFYELYRISHLMRSGKVRTQILCHLCVAHHARDSHLPRTEQDLFTRAHLLDAQESWDWPLQVLQRVLLLATKRQAARRRTAKESALAIGFSRLMALWSSIWRFCKCGACSAVRRTQLSSLSWCPAILEPHTPVLCSAQRQPGGVHATRCPYLRLGIPHGRRHLV